MVPSALETWAAATILVRSFTSFANASMSSAPLSWIGATRSRAPVCRQTSCHGTMFEWCSMVVMTISSPGPRRGRAQLCATRFSPSVAPRTKTISRRSAALRNALTVSRAPSQAFVARSLSACSPRWTFALSDS